MPPTPGPPPAAPAPPPDPTAAREATLPWEARFPVLLPVAAALAAKVVVILLAFAWLDRPLDFWHRMAWQWDGLHYLGLIQQNGYQFGLHGAGDSVHFAFLYPLVVHLLGGSDVAGLAVNNAASLLAVAVVARHWGTRPALALALFPAWIVFGSVAYTEGLFVLLAALALAALERGRQVPGGLWAALATCARYFGGPALLAAAIPWRHLRDPQRYVAAILLAMTAALLGTWMWLQTGTPMGLFESEKPWGGAVAWPWEHFTWLLTAPFTHQTGLLGAGRHLSPIAFATRDVLFLVPAAAGLVLLWRARAARLPSFAFSAVAVALAICTTGTPAAALPRYLVSAFPALAAVGSGLRSRMAWLAYAVVGLALAVDGLANHLFGYWS